MPAKRLSMHQIIEVLRLKHAAHLSHRQIARALKISTGTVTNYLSSAQRAGLSWPLPDGVDADRAEARFENAVLTVRIPKIAAKKSDVRRLEIT